MVNNNSCVAAGRGGKKKTIKELQYLRDHQRREKL